MDDRVRQPVRPGRRPRDREGLRQDAGVQSRGRSIPVVATFQEILGLPSVLFGVGLPDENAHAPNEKLDLGNFHGGIIASAYLYDEIAGCAVARMRASAAVAVRGVCDAHGVRRSGARAAEGDDQGGLRQGDGKADRADLRREQERPDRYLDRDGRHRPVRSRIDGNEDGRIDGGSTTTRRAAASRLLAEGRREPDAWATRRPRAASPESSFVEPTRAHRSVGGLRLRPLGLVSTAQGRLRRRRRHDHDGRPTNGSAMKTAASRRPSSTRTATAARPAADLRGRGAGPDRDRAGRVRELHRRLVLRITRDASSTTPQRADDPAHRLRHGRRARRFRARVSRAREAPVRPDANHRRGAPSRTRARPRRSTGDRGSAPDADERERGAARRSRSRSTKARRRREDKIWQAIESTPNFWSTLKPIDERAVRRIHG